jgi:cytoskeleton-associated protein 5
LGNKNPQIKEGTLKFLARSLSTSTTPVQTGQIKTLTDPLAVLLEDGFEGARNEAAACLGILMKMVGERPLNALMDGLADIRKAKVKEAYEKAVVKCKAGAPKAPVAAKEPPKKKVPPSQKTGGTALPKAEVTDALMIDEEPPKKPAGKPPARLMVRIFFILRIFLTFDHYIRRKLRRLLRHWKQVPQLEVPQSRLLLLSRSLLPLLPRNPQSPPLPLHLVL